MGETAPNSYKTLPDEAGRFGIHGGRFVAETLMPLILEVEKGLLHGQIRSQLPLKIAVLSKTLYRPAVPFIFRLSPDGTFWRGKAVSEAR